MALGFALIGFCDDYVKVAKKQNLGLTARQKLMFQFLVAALYLASLRTAGTPRRRCGSRLSGSGSWVCSIIRYAPSALYTSSIP
jgi:UDP-N-acetylmuramyl pentapeptide phosphotransferase/UDP-N-acetylglucosamine-1-phosphate transferase